MKNHTSNSQLKVDGKMNAKDAGQVGKMQATALIIFALSALITAIGMVLWAIK